MHITYKIPSYEYMIKSIVEFQEDDQGDFFGESLFYFYPTIDKEKVKKMNREEREEYIGDSLKHIFDEKREELIEKVEKYQGHWNKNEKIITSTFEEIFEIDLKTLFSDLEANLTLNPVCPRFLEKKSFDVFYLNSEKGALGISLHEIVHFIWFYKWKKMFDDSEEEYETPHLKWVFSEIVVDAILNDERIKALNPYESSIYPYFHEIEIDGEKLVDIVEKLFAENSILDFMIKGYDLCVQNEAAIREVMY